MAGEQMSQEVRKFCNDIGTTLWALEEGTPWSNKAGLIRPNCTLGSSRMQSERTCVNLTHQCVYGTTVWKDMQGLIISWLRMILSCMERHLTLQPWLKKPIYPPFASLDCTSGVTIVNILPLFPTTVKYLDGSWAPLEVKVMKWPNGFSRLMGELC